MACFTRVAEKNWNHYRALSRSAIQTWLDGGSRDQAPGHGCPLGRLTPVPTFLPHPCFGFPWRQRLAPAMVLSQRLAQWCFDASFKLLRYGNIDNNQRYKQGRLQGEMNTDARNIRGYIQSLFSCCWLTLSLVPLIFNECHRWWT